MQELIPITIRLPLHAAAWSGHAVTTVMDHCGAVLAECSGHGQRSGEAAAIAAEIVRRVNAHNDLLLACKGLLLIAESGVMRQELIEAARAVIAEAAGAAA